MSSKLNSSSRFGWKRFRRYIMLGFVILSVGLAIYIGLEFRENGPNYYAPGRTALINARLKFEESLAYEQAVLVEKQKAHKEIIQAIDQLAKAEDLDPADRSRIEDMRQTLMAIDKADCNGGASPEQLQQQYHDLLNEIDTLISNTENYPR